VRQAVRRRSRAEELEQRGIAFPLVRERFDQADREGRYLLHEGAQDSARQMQDLTAFHRFGGPHVLPAAENFGTAGEVTRCPVGERDLPRVRPDVERTHPPAADDEYAVVAKALLKNDIARLVLAEPRVAHDFGVLLRGQASEHVRVLVDFDEGLGHVKRALRWRVHRVGSRAGAIPSIHYDRHYGRFRSIER
jgi:hypothetical protein